MDTQFSCAPREDRDLAFELLEAYIERESDSGGREDYDRIRGLVPHMRKRLWKAPSKQQVSPVAGDYVQQSLSCYFFHPVCCLGPTSPARSLS